MTSIISDDILFFMENRRKFPRVEKSFQVKYYPQSKSSRFGYTIANDISRGGISIPALSSIAGNGEILRMDINNRDGKGTISATGKVKWVSPLKRKALLDERVGIEFTNIAPADLDRLVKTS